MTKQEKFELVAELTETLNQKPNVYIADSGGMTVAQVNKLRRVCFEAGIEMKVVKNTLLKKAMMATGRNYEAVFPTLKQQSAVFFVAENLTAPAKVLKKFRSEGNEKPLLKSAVVDEAAFIGDSSLESLAALKSKNELIADVIAALQAPARNVISALQNGGGTIAGIVKTLSGRPE